METDSVANLLGFEFWLPCILVLWPWASCYTFPIELLWPLSEIDWPCMYGSPWFYIVPLMYMSILMPTPHCFNYWNITNLQIRSCDPSNFVFWFFFLNSLAVVSKLHLYIHNRISFSTSKNKSLLGFWMGLCWIYKSAWGVLTSKQSLNLPVHDYGTVFINLDLF